MNAPFDLLRSRYRHLVARADDARASTELSRMGLGFTPWTASALRPAALLQLVNEILINRRDIVVELGAGISTLYLAKALAQIGGRLVSIEDDAEWSGIVKAMLDREGLGNHVQIITAPLGHCVAAEPGLEWYDPAIVGAALAGTAIDLLLIDGPKAYTSRQALARLPAWRMLGRHLAPRAAMALDDADRPGETAILARWQADPDFDFEIEAGPAGLALCRRGSFYTTAL